MDFGSIGSLHRRLRHGLRLRQVDVASSSGVSRNKVSFIENGHLDDVSVAELQRTLTAMGARLDVNVRRGGAALERLLDEGHALLAGVVANFLRRSSWLVEIEVSFSHFGERGSIDLLAWHAATRTLLVIEIKTELGSIEGLLRPLDLKVRNAARIAREQFGWQPVVIARLVALPESSATRRAVARHAAVLSLALPATSHAVGEWLAGRRAT